MATIQHITAREILNARGNPTIETTMTLDNNQKVTASCPSGTSVSSYEAVELHDGDTRRFDGLGVKKAIENITKIITPSLLGKDTTQQQEIDNIMIELDGTPNKNKLGANAILCVSLCVARAAALSKNVSLCRYIASLAGISSFKIPTPLFNVINGGKHAQNSFDLQEFIITSLPSATFSDSLQMAYTIYHTLKKMLLLNNLSTLIGDEGGYSPALSTNSDALAFLKTAIEESGYRLGVDTFLGTDAAATSFFKDGRNFIKDKQTPQTNAELIPYYEKLATDFDLIYMEDVMAEDDWDGWIHAMAMSSEKRMIVGDDLISTNPARLQMAIDKKAVSGVIIKPNQIGTVSETIAVVKQAQSAGLIIIVFRYPVSTFSD